MSETIRFSIPYFKTFTYNDEIQEFDIKYDRNKDSLQDLFDFISQYPGKRINIELMDPYGDFGSLSTLDKLHAQIYFKLSAEHLPLLEEFSNRLLRYYFTIPATSWDVLDSLINSGTTDIYISGELGFNIPKVTSILEREGINSRVIVDLKQSLDPMENSNDITSFFIRPEDIEGYAQFINVFEFCNEFVDQTRFEVLYRIYVKEQRWPGPLAALITNFQKEVNNKNLLPEFASFRLDCGKRCYQGSGCAICYRLDTLSDILENQKLEIIKRES